MVVEWLILTTCLLGQTSAPATGGWVPPDRRIEARVSRTLSAPSSNVMHMPTDVAVDSKGRVYVADGTNDRVLAFGANGQLQQAITRADPEAFSQPVGIAVDSADRLWVADTRRHRVLVVGTDGRLAERIDLPPFDAEHPFDPTDVAITPDGKRTYIVDNSNHRVVVRDNARKDYVSLGSFGRALGQFEFPFMICLGPSGDACVSEAIGARVQRISPRDLWVGQTGRWGVEAGQLYRPKGVAVDVRDRLYVGDSTLGVVQVFDPRGNLVGVLSNSVDPRSEPLHFQHPMGMCFDAAGRLYVVELKANRVAVVALPDGWLPAASRPAGVDSKPGS